MKDRKKTLANLCARSDSSELLDDSIFLRRFNHLLHDDRWRIDLEQLTSWREGARIPNRYLGYLSRLFNIRYIDYTGFQEIFSLEDYLTSQSVALQRTLEEPRGFDKGFFADFYLKLESLLIEDRVAFANRLGVYPSVLDACADGSAIPSDELATKIISTLDMNGQATKVAVARIQMDHRRLADEPKKLAIASALGRVTHQTSLKNLVNNILSERRFFPLEIMHRTIDGFSRYVLNKLRSGEISPNDAGFYQLSTIRSSALGFATEGTAAYQIFVDVGLQNKSMLNGDEIVKKFVKDGGKSIGELLKAIMRERKMTVLRELSEASGIGLDTLHSWSAEKCDFILPESIAAIQNYLNLKSDEAKLDLRALANGGDITLGGHFEILQSARDIMEGRPLPQRWEERNIVHEYMWRHKLIEHPEDITEDKVVRALFLVLFDRYGATTNQIKTFEKGGVEGEVIEMYKKGEERIGYTVVNGIEKVQFNRIKNIANFFSASPEGSKELALLILGFAREIPMEELTEQLAELRISHGQLLRRNRLQKLEYAKDYVADKPFSADAYLAWERGCISKEHDSIPSYVDAIGVRADDPNRYALIDSLNGTHPSISSEFFEEIVATEFERNAPDSFQNLISAMMDYTGKRNAESFCQIIPINNNRGTAKHVSACAIRSWCSGGYTNLPSMAGALATAAGYEDENDTVRDQIVRIAMNTVPRFDPSVMDAINSNSTAEEKSNAYKALMKNAGLSHKQLHQRIWKSDAGFTSDQVRQNMARLSTRAETIIEDPIRRRDFLSAMANELIFDEEHQEQRIKFLNAFGQDQEKESAVSDRAMKRDTQEKVVFQRL